MQEVTDVKAAPEETVAVDIVTEVVPEVVTEVKKHIEDVTDVKGATKTHVLVVKGLVAEEEKNQRDQEDDLFDSMWASGEDQHLHEENIQTRLHDFEPMKSLSGYIADSSNSPVAQLGSSRNGSIVLQAFSHHFKPDKPKELPEKPMEHHSCF
ncbi:hypothetical protein LWI28_008045 [Acer negundo]|uniref:Uncharacterized protein n=1 Tax=Acer negundo TaxID=4023 RepID=A0AAD5NII9_ACENE|nr:hypothetical protein LWI28_008045 [Acer negundo]